MKTLALAFTALLFAGSCPAADKLYLSRTFTLDFADPGKITRIEAAGEKPVSEDGRNGAYTLVMPKRLNLTMTISAANAEEHRGHIVFVLRDEEAPTQRVEATLAPTDTIKFLWLDVYRVRVTLLRKDATVRGNFNSAMIKVEVFVPEPKKRPVPEPE